MKVKLYFENEKAIRKSGIGRAMLHQKEALKQNNIEYTTNHKDKDYDLLHINTFYLASYLEVRRAKKLNKKIVFHAHSTKEDFANSFAFSNMLAPIYQKWLLFMYQKSDAIITPTPYSKSLLKGYGLKQPITAISNGIDASRFTRDEEKEKKFRDFFKLKESDKVVISVGWLFERKGFDTFCEVASLLPDYTFIWFGDKNLSMPSKKIRDWINNLPSNMVLPGYIDGDIITGAYTSADVFFFPTREETEGIVVLEALAAKTKVLVRDIPVFHPWLKNSVNCYMGNDTADFVSLLPDIIEEKLPNLVEEGYQVVAERSLDKIGLQLKKVYEMTLREKA